MMRRKPTFRKIGRFAAYLFLFVGLFYPATGQAQAPCKEGATQPCYTGGPECTKKGDTYFCLGYCKGGIQTCKGGQWGTCVGEILPSGEKCDGLDNNCNDKIDEGCKCTDGEKQACYSRTPGTMNVSPCKAGSQTCNRNRWGPCQGEVIPQPEKCDGIDNDCDGLVDENFPKKGQPCEVGKGICLRQGIWICKTDGSGVICDATPGKPVTEICNSKDDDCDGKIDEGCQCVEGTQEPCFSGNTGCLKTNGVYQCTAPCKTGTRVCTKGVWGACQGEVLAQLEKCDAKDNDCDGAVDEDFPSKGKACKSGLGTCERAGVLVCKADGSGLTCNAKPGTPASETCDGKDNDCDGTIDEGCKCTTGDTQPCYSGDAGCTRTSSGTYNCIPPCKTGTQTCGKKGQWGLCVGEVNAQLEMCDGKDNDCDGKIDENYPEKGKACMSGVGECQRPGKYVCKPSGIGLQCNATPGAPAPETCDGKDNDCDGSADEEFPTKGQVCQAGVGACAAKGKFVCKADGTGVECDAKPGAPAAKEDCNGKDDDCDGQIDEGFPGVGQPCKAGKGACEKIGISVCKADGSGVECNAKPGTPAAKEICGNGKDDDCNGSVDDGCQCTAGQTQSCFSGQDGCVPQPGGTYKCTAPCKAGTQTCQSGKWSNCTGEALAQPEKCDGKDNDCDGKIDEDFVQKGKECQVGVGECEKKGKFVCKADGSGTECDAKPGTPSAEVCNDHKDNDCDGSVDEDCQCMTGNVRSCYSEAVGCAPDGKGYKCQGECKAGVQTCSGGKWGLCLGEVHPSAEVCDDKDNNCDGSVDEIFSSKGQACKKTVGTCEVKGKLACKADGSGTECDAVVGQEVCDGQDNDCDGQIDEDGVCNEIPTEGSEPTEGIQDRPDGGEVPTEGPIEGSEGTIDGAEGVTDGGEGMTDGGEGVPPETPPESSSDAPSDRPVTVDGIAGEKGADTLTDAKIQGGGCNCNSHLPSSPAPFWLLLLLALFPILRRRNR